MEIDYCLIGKITVGVLAPILYLVFSFGLVCLYAWTFNRFWAELHYPRKLVAEAIVDSIGEATENTPILELVCIVFIVALAPILMPLGFLEIAIKMAKKKMASSNSVPSP